MQSMLSIASSRRCSFLFSGLKCSDTHTHTHTHAHTHTSPAVVSAGIRAAGPADLDAIAALLKPLEEKGILVARTRGDIANTIQVSC